MVGIGGSRGYSISVMGTLSACRSVSAAQISIRPSRYRKATSSRPGRTFMIPVITFGRDRRHPGFGGESWIWTNLSAAASSASSLKTRSPSVFSDSTVDRDRESNNWTSPLDSTSSSDRSLYRPGRPIRSHALIGLEPEIQSTLEQKGCGMSTRPDLSTRMSIGSGGRVTFYRILPHHKNYKYSIYYKIQESSLTTTAFYHIIHTWRGLIPNVTRCSGTRVATPDGWGKIWHLEGNNGPPA
jgi:hypothetical protein